MCASLSAADAADDDDEGSEWVVIIVQLVITAKFVTKVMMVSHFVRDSHKEGNNFFIWRQSKPGCHCLTWVQFYLAMEGGGLFLVFSSRPAFLDDALGGGRDCCDH